MLKLIRACPEVLDDIIFSLQISMSMVYRKHNINFHIFFWNIPCGSLC